MAAQAMAVKREALTARRPASVTASAFARCSGANLRIRERVDVEKTGKNHKKPSRSPFLAPFRADQATAASDIVVRMVADEMRHLTVAAVHKMSVYAWSAFSP